MKDMMMNFRSIVTLAVAVAALSAPLSAMAEDTFGALAYSPKTGSYGWSSGFDHRRTAEGAAMENCLDNARDCQVAIYFRNACGAVAVGDNGGWGSDWGDDRRAAERAAVRVCRQHDDGCKVIVKKCSDD